MNLLLDLGNSRIKWGTRDVDGGVTASGARAWDKGAADALHAQWTSVPQPQAVWAASVVDSTREAAVAAAVLARFGQPVTWVRTAQEGCGVRNGYAEPDTLGVDRFLAMVAAHADGLSPCILVSAGTAVVLDALDGGGRHLGGLIAPGTALMQQSVRDAAAGVKPRSPGRVRNVASNTADALASGCWLACAALIDRFAARMAGVLGGAPTLLLGGGDADALLPLVEHAATAYPDAVLRGLAVWASRAA